MTVSYALETLCEAWWKTSAVARRCGVTGETVRAWVKAGKLSAKRTPGGQYRINPAEVEALLVDVAEPATAHTGSAEHEAEVAI